MEPISSKLARLNIKSSDANSAALTANASSSLTITKAQKVPNAADCFKKSANENVEEDDAKFYGKIENFFNFLTN